MRFALSEEQMALRDVVRRSFEAKTQPDSHDDRRRADVGVWRRLATDEGLVGLGVPEKFGGQGAGALEVMLLLHESGRTLLPGPFLGTIALALPAFLMVAEPPARQRWVPEIVAGREIATVALHDDMSRDFLAVAEGTVRRDGAQHLVTASRSAVPDADIATLFLVLAREAADGDDAGRVGLFAVPRGEAVTVSPYVGGIDLERTYAQVSFRDAPCEPLWTGKDVGALAEWLDVASILVSGELVGAAERCLELSLDHGRARYQFGRPIGSFQATKHRCVDMFVELELARAAVEYAAWAVDGRPDVVPLAAPTALAAATGAATLVTQEAIHVHGGIGFTWEHILHRYLRRVRALNAFVGDRDTALRRIVDRSGWVTTTRERG